MSLLRAVASQPWAALQDRVFFLNHASGQEQAYTSSAISVFSFFSLLSQQALVESAIWRRLLIILSLVLTHVYKMWLR